MNANTRISPTRAALLPALLACTILGCQQDAGPGQTNQNPTGETPTGKAAGGQGGDTTKSASGAVLDTVEPGALSVGPYHFVDLANGDFVETAGSGNAPWYLLPFDKFGTSEAPLTRAGLIGSLRNHNYTDVFIFSHGWNNDWATANALYNGWIKGYVTFRNQNHLDLGGREFRPLFVGIIWPSTALVLPSEQGPTFRSVQPDMNDFVGQERAEVRALAEGVPEASRARFYELTQRPPGGGLSDQNALELATILAPTLKTNDAEVGEDPAAPSPEELRDAWKAVGAQSQGNVPMQDLGRFRADLSRFDPRWIVRVATVWQMKDRAGVVGSKGVGPLLDAILGFQPPAGQTAPRVHLLGHSFGAKVVLSALCTGTKPRKVNSVLLLQPAISYLCFSPDAAGQNRPGGYVDAPNRSEQPILSTYTGCDQPLTQFFHLALRRSSDLGERAANTPPSVYAALGGFGPAVGPGVSSVTLVDFPTRYPINEPGRKIIGIKGTPPGGDCNNTAGIDGHGDVSNDHTYWMLYNQLINPPTP